MDRNHDEDQSFASLRTLCAVASESWVTSSGCDTLELLCIFLTDPSWFMRRNDSIHSAGRTACHAPISSFFFLLHDDVGSLSPLAHTPTSSTPWRWLLRSLSVLTGPVCIWRRKRSTRFLIVKQEGPKQARFRIAWVLVLIDSHFFITIEARR